MYISEGRHCGEVSENVEKATPHCPVRQDLRFNFTVKSAGINCINYHYCISIAGVSTVTDPFVSHGNEQKAAYFPVIP